MNYTLKPTAAMLVAFMVVGIGVGSVVARVSATSDDEAAQPLSTQFPYRDPSTSATHLDADGVAVALLRGLRAGGQRQVLFMLGNIRATTGCGVGVAFFKKDSTAETINRAIRKTRRAARQVGFAQEDGLRAVVGVVCPR